MAKTVDQYSTLEQFRTRYNDLANDVGDISGLRTENQETIVDAVNSLEDKSFFFQEFIFTASASQTSFSGADSFGNTMSFRTKRVQVYLNDKHLIADTDFSIGGFGVVSGNTYSSLTLIGSYSGGASAGDKLSVYAYTGSYLGVVDTGAVSGFFTNTAAQSIYNTNDSGVILNGDGSNRTTALSDSSNFNIELAGNTLADGNLKLNTGGTFTAPTITDGTLSISSGTISSGVAATFSGAVTGGSLTDGTATITSGTGTGFSSITSTSFTGNLTGNVTGNLTGDVTGDVTGTVSSIANHDTGDLTEGSNLYYTDARVDSRMSGKDLNFFDDVNYTTTPTAGQILVWDNANQYWEPADNSTTSDSITEGSNNLYFTNARTSTRVDTILNHSNHSNVTVSKVGDELRFSASAQYGDSDVQSYLSGGDGLTLSGSGSFSVNTSNGVKTDSDNVVLDYEIVSSAPSSAGSTSTGHLWFVV